MPYSQNRNDERGTPLENNSSASTGDRLAVAGRFHFMARPRPKNPRIEPELLPQPTFDDYVAARRVVLYLYDELRRENYKGKLNIASDEMVARIVQRSCPGLQNPHTVLKDPTKQLLSIEGEGTDNLDAMIHEVSVRHGLGQPK